MLSSFSPLFGKKVLLLTHAGADVDAVASAAAIHFALKGKARTTIAIPDHLNLNAVSLTKKLQIPYSINPSFKGYEAIIILDFNKSKMAGSLQGELENFKGERFLIDHHSKEAEVIAPKENSFCNSKAISTTELVYSLLKNSSLKIPKSAYLCIASGIITDSSSFLIADHNTFRIMAEVMEKANAPYSDISTLFKVEKDFSEKIAALKAAKRAKIFKVGESIIALSEVGAFEAEAASALIRLGADVSFCGFSDEKMRISGRVNNKWLSEHKFDLARDVFNPLEGFFDGEGGGHAGASGFNGEGDLWSALEKCLELTHEFLNKKQKVPLKEYS